MRRFKISLMTESSPNTSPPRREYIGSGLKRDDLPSDPLELFTLWLQAATHAGIYEPNTMLLSTVGENGQPAGRAVLLKGYDQQGLVFYTNTSSRKAQEISNQPRVCLTFVWDILHRQIRLEGTAEPLPTAQVAEYFASRPPGARIAAAASPQSQVIPDREWLEERVDRLWEQYPEGELELPMDWGGFRVRLEQVEFWQGREFRLHDRFRYRRIHRGWVIDRLAP